MPTPSPPRGRLLIATAILLAVTGSAFFNLQPLFFAAAQPLFNLTDSQIGWLAASELAGIALASLFLTLVADNYNFRVISSGGLVFMIAGNIATLLADNFIGLALIRFVTGFLGDGVVYISAILLLGRSASPTRLFGFMVFINMMVTATGLKLLPALFPDNLWPGLLFTLAGIAAIALLFTTALPGKIRSASPGAESIRLSKLAIYLLLAICAFAINLGVIWSYAERLGTAAGLGLDEVSSYLSYSLPLQAIGALVAALLGSRLGIATPAMLVVLCQTTAIISLIGSSPGNEWRFFAGISLWGFSWNFGIAYLLGQAARIKSGHRLLILVPCVEAIGVAAGPAIAATMLSGDSYLAVHVTAISAIAISTGLLIWVNRAQARGNGTRNPGDGFPCPGRQAP